MNGGAVASAVIGNAILIDEVGLESGVYGEYRLRSAIQPIFERRGAHLVPVAVEGLVSPHLAGEAISTDRFFGGVPAGDRLFVEAVCRAIQLRNYRNTGAEGLDLWFRYDPRANPDFAGFLRATSLLAGSVPEAGLDPQRLVCEIAEADMLDPPGQARLAAGMRGLGASIAVDDFGTGEFSLERIGQISPEFIRMDGPWFRKLCRETTAIRLLASLIEGFRLRGTKILIGGIEDAAQLGHALGCRADLFQGPFIAPPRLVGTALDTAPLAVGALLRRSGTVVPLFRGPRWPTR